MCRPADLCWEAPFPDHCLEVVFPFPFFFFYGHRAFLSAPFGVLGRDVPLGPRQALVKLNHYM